MRHRSHALAFGGFRHIEHLDYGAVLIAEEGILGAETGAKPVVDLRRVHADHGKLTVIDRQFFLKFNIVAQLHLTLRSPIATIERQNKRELADQLRKFNLLAVLIRQCDIGKLLTGRQIHKNLREFSPMVGAGLGIALGHFAKKTFFFELL
jgi:hypothetical protein